jgi:hypothetical protein
MSVKFPPFKVLLSTVFKHIVSKQILNGSNLLHYVAIIEHAPVSIIYNTTIVYLFNVFKMDDLRTSVILLLLSVGNYKCTRLGWPSVA